MGCVKTLQTALKLQFALTVTDLLRNHRGKMLYAVHHNVPAQAINELRPILLVPSLEPMVQNKFNALSDQEEI